MRTTYEQHLRRWAFAYCSKVSSTGCKILLPECIFTLSCLHQRMCRPWSLCTLCLLACQMELPQAIHVSVVVDFVCWAVFTPFVCWFFLPRIEREMCMHFFPIGGLADWLAGHPFFCNLPAACLSAFLSVCLSVPLSVFCNISKNSDREFQKAWNSNSAVCLSVCLSVPLSVLFNISKNSDREFQKAWNSNSAVCQHSSSFETWSKLLETRRKKNLEK